MAFSMVLSRAFIKVDVYKHEVGYHALQNILKFLTSKLFINTRLNETVGNNNIFAKGSLRRFQLEF